MAVMCARESCPRVLGALTMPLMPHMVGQRSVDARWVDPRCVAVRNGRMPIATRT